jgi:hypothetical protein
MAQTINVTTDYTGRQIDLEMFRAPDKPVNLWRIQLKMNVNGGPRRVTAIQKLVQRYANLLMQTIDSIHFDQDAGSSLFNDLQIGGTYTAEQCLHSFVFANAQVLTQLRTEDANPDYGTPVTDEMIKDAILLELENLRNSGTLIIKVQLVTLEDDVVTFAVPLGPPDQ